MASHTLFQSVILNYFLTRLLFLCESSGNYLFTLFQFQIKDDIEPAVKLELQERSELEFVSCNETQNSGAHNLKVTIGELNFVSRINETQILQV